MQLAALYLCENQENTYRILIYNILLYIAYAIVELHFI